MHFVQQIKREKKIKNIETSDLGYFGEDRSKNYLIFQLVFKFFKLFINSINKCCTCISKGLSKESITTPFHEKQ